MIKATNFPWPHSQLFSVFLFANLPHAIEGTWDAFRC